MPSTFWGLDIGKTGLYTYQAALNTTGHNISNLETDGYSRQIVRQQAARAISLHSSYGMAGNGVELLGIEQTRNQYYDNKFRSNNTIYGNYNTKYYYTSQIQTYLNEFANDGFSVSFQNLDNAMKELAKQTDGTGMPQRHQVAQNALALTEYFNNLATNLKRIQSDSNFEIKSQVNRINSIAQQVSVLTKQINTIEMDGSTANDLRDQRNLLVDQLSQIVDVEVTEKRGGLGKGMSEYNIYIKGNILVSSTSYNTLKTVPREDKVNLNDEEGLYDVEWSNGDTFTITPGGTLEALFNVRDGNNQQNMRGTAKSGVVDGANASVGETSIKLVNSNINSMSKLNIPQDGTITIDNRDYHYTSFTAKKNANGDYEYTFQLDEGLVKDMDSNTEVKIGDSIDYKGIPYYMAQLNEFVRVYASQFNAQHKKGQDITDDADFGVDFFNALKVNGDEWAGTNKTAHIVTDGFLDIDEDSFSSTDASYYQMTVENFTVTGAIINDPRLIAAADPSITDGKGKYGNIDKLIQLKTDNNMFKQGTPDSYLQTMVAAIGIDTKKAEEFAISQEKVLLSVDNQRLSVSGVDFDEEAMNMMRYKNAYNMSAKIISVMNEIYNKLINEMGV